MNEVPSLITLCIGAIKNAILDEENGNLHHIYLLPAELFDQIVQNLPSLALQNLQDAMPYVNNEEACSSDDCSKESIERKRLESFSIAWRTLFKSRWKDVQHDELTTDWQQHLRSCLDATEEMVFHRFLGKVGIPDTLLQLISCEVQVSRSKSYSKLNYQFERFGVYARCLRLHSIQCVAEICNLLRNCQLENLDINCLKTKEQVFGVCKLLEQNKETLASVEFVKCELLADHVSDMCDSLHMQGFENNVIKRFSIKRSMFFNCSPFPLPPGLELLLLKARGLTSLILCDDHIRREAARLVFDTLLETESGLQVLNLSQNNIKGWLSHIKRRTHNCINPDLHTNKRLDALRVLNLRACNLQKDDADCLKYAMVYMPNLEVLDLSGNHLKNNGIESLIPYFVEKSKSDTPLTDLYLENCEISLNGASQLLQALAQGKLELLDLQQNPFCEKSDVAYVLAEFQVDGRPNILL
ncbi:uncharacterized protein [Rutidosis leptorrhynchoides]|uniref:uncharacterized protein n=1 Tax=Rutidosis leptorrhynchoides TaxID=125765 RepID=UPI003A99B517